MTNRHPPDTFMSEIYIYKPFEMNDGDSFPYGKLPKVLSLYEVPRTLLHLIFFIMLGVGRKRNVPH